MRISAGWNFRKGQAVISSYQQNRLETLGLSLSARGGRREFFALDEDRKYLPNLVSTLKQEAELEVVRLEKLIEEIAAWHWAERFRVLHDQKYCTPLSLKILRRAEKTGYTLTVEKDRTIAATKSGEGTSYLRSNFEIEHWGRVFT